MLHAPMLPSPGKMWIQEGGGGGIKTSRWSPHSVSKSPIKCLNHGRRGWGGGWTEGSGCHRGISNWEVRAAVGWDSEALLWLCSVLPVLPLLAAHWKLPFK